MRELLALLEKVKVSFKVVMIYIHEAHADDVWPVGYGINSAKNLDEKWQNCNAHMKQWPELNEHIDQIFVDNMDNDFINISGCWPEGFYFTDSIGQAKWGSKMLIDTKVNILNAEIYLESTFGKKD